MQYFTLVGALVRNLLVSVREIFLSFRARGISRVLAYPDDYLARLMVIALKSPEHICTVSLERVKMTVTSLRETCKNLYMFL